jgi:hypothetical protein
MTSFVTIFNDAESMQKLYMFYSVVGHDKVINTLYVMWLKAYRINAQSCTFITHSLKTYLS